MGGGGGGGGGALQQLASQPANEHGFSERLLEFRVLPLPRVAPLGSYSEELGKWMEVGNSGMFRPEMLRPMGLPEGVNVIAWGLSLER